jgi:tetratricopeptide (TPR) repeat protein
MANKNKGVGRRPSGASRRNTNQGEPIREGDDLLVDMVEVSDQAASFFEKNRNTIIGAALVLAALVIGFVVYQTFVTKPKEANAMEQMQRAQFQFEQDSFNLALANPGQGFPGFLDIIDQFGSTNAGNLASYYAGVSYMNIGSYDAALDYLNQFDADGEVMPIMKAGTLGDVESELGNFDSAISNYESAVNKAGKNYLLGGYYLKKLGLLLRNQGNDAEALKAFNRLKNEYGNSPEAAEADKYIMLLSK